MMNIKKTIRKKMRLACVWERFTYELAILAYQAALSVDKLMQTPDVDFKIKRIVVDPESRQITEVEFNGRTYK